MHTCNTLSENTLLENTFSEETLSENTLFENTLLKNTLLENTLWVYIERSYQHCLQSIGLSNTTETSIILCGKAQPPLVGRGGLEPPPPAPYASALKG